MLTSDEFHRLADVPPEVEWFANLTNAHTRRAYPPKSPLRLPSRSREMTARYKNPANAAKSTKEKSRNLTNADPEAIVSRVGFSMAIPGQISAEIDTAKNGARGRRSLRRS